MNDIKYDREKYSNAIVLSKDKKKIIVAGPGTGKTFTFKQVSDSIAGNKIILTFIRKLVSEMKPKFDSFVEVKTFHELCKGLLHKKLGYFDIEPFLPKIIQEDSDLLELGLSDFSNKFRNIEENSGEIKFYLDRSDYYETLSFDDSVYRFYKLASEDNTVLPHCQQIIIDEYQDFNKLEVSFIELLAVDNPILIAGDDDLAVYEGRCSSSKYIRDLYKSGNYTVFELPFCSRCPKVIVDSVNGLINESIKRGYLKDRIQKRYECFLPSKEEDSKKYPLITSIRLSNVSAIAKYIRKEIGLIDQKDIQDSYKEGEEYPTALIIGGNHLLKKIEPILEKDFNVIKSHKKNDDYSITDAFRLLIKNECSNLGWRIIMDLFSVDSMIIKKSIRESLNSSSCQLLDFIPSDRYPLN